MDTEQFLSRILPTCGRTAVVFIHNKIPKQWFYNDKAKATGAIQKLEATGQGAVYHGCAAYDLSGFRQAENVVAVKAFWLDLDCGPTKAYASKEDALSGLEAFATKLGLWEPCIVNSGRGLHVYWVLESEVTPLQWKPVAESLKRACTVEGLHAGPERTADVASVLRPVGTTHRKDPDDLRPVYIEDDHEGVNGTFEAFQAALLPYATEADELGEMPSNLTSISKLMDSNDDLSGGMGYDPVDPAQILLGCEVLRNFSEGKETQSEPLWRACLGVVKHFVDGERLAHEWSAKEPDEANRAKPAEVQAKLDRIKGGPTTCNTLSTHSEACKSCPFYGKIASPISLANKTVPVTSAAPTALQLPPMPHPKFRWAVQPNGRTVIEALVWDKVKNVDDWRLLCEVPFYADDHIDKGGGFDLPIVAYPQPTKRIEFLVAGSVINDKGKLMACFGNDFIFAEPGMDLQLQTLVREWAKAKQRHATARKAYTKFGWHDKDFLVGSTLYTKTGEKTVVLSGSAKQTERSYIPKGSLDKWKELIDRAYNHNGDEHRGVKAYQFAIVLGLSAPLMRLFNDYGSTFVYMYSGNGGQGKTTATRNALSVWGKWKELQITNERATGNALYATAATMSNMPLVIDEMTNMEDKDVSQLVYGLSDGSDKKRCNAAGVLAHNPDASWETFVLGSGNRLLSERLAQFRGNANAERSRLFEITADLSKSYLKDGEPMELFPQFLENYGWAGREMAKYIVANYAGVMKSLLTTQKSICQSLNTTNEERYWLVLMACTMVGFKIAKEKLGLINFDWDEFLAWLEDAFLDNRADLARQQLRSRSLFESMMTDLTPGIIITHGKGTSANNGWAMIQQPHPHGAITGRHIIATQHRNGRFEPEELYITEDAAVSWCKRRQVSLKDVYTDGKKAGRILGKKDFAIGTGTIEHKSAGRLTCWEVKPHQSQQVAAAPPAQTNVTTLAAARKKP